MTSLLQVVYQDERDLAAAWRKDAEARRKQWSADPVAAILAYCAAELEERVRAQELRTAYLTPVEYAEMRGVSAQTVRRWIKRGYLEAARTTHGYMINARATVSKRRQGAGGRLGDVSESARRAPV